MRFYEDNNNSWPSQTSKCPKEKKLGVWLNSNKESRLQKIQQGTARETKEARLLREAKKEGALKADEKPSSSLVH